MKYHKFEKIVKGESPIIRVTYIARRKKLIVRDICKCNTVEGFWVFMDTGDLTHNFDPINAFYKGDRDVYLVNSQANDSHFFIED